MKILAAFSFFCALMIVSVWARRVASIDDRWVCDIKKTCRDCLKFSHCSWCPTENKCFSSQLPGREDFCKNSSIVHKDMFTSIPSVTVSLEEFAECACTPPEELKQNCRPPGNTDGEDCYGRGSCVCGRCNCASPFDNSKNDTKMIFGEYCQWDNFSCDDPRCNEGPYSIAEEDADARLKVDMPADVAE